MYSLPPWVQIGRVYLSTHPPAIGWYIYCWAGKTLSRAIGQSGSWAAGQPGSQAAEQPYAGDLQNTCHRLVKYQQNNLIDLT